MMIRYTSLAALVSTYGVMVLGSYVSASGLGLSCTDWPLCRGNVLPTEEIMAEWVHRFFGLLAASFAVTTLVLALRSKDTRIKITASLAVTFVFTQVTLGVIVIDSRLNPVLVAVHLAIGVLLFTSVLLTVLRADALSKGKALSKSL